MFSCYLITYALKTPIKSSKNLEKLNDYLGTQATAEEFLYS